jgi:hypothetical protein
MLTKHGHFNRKNAHKKFQDFCDEFIQIYYIESLDILPKVFHTCH